MNLYVGNLPYNATEEDIANLFLEIGEVQEVKILVDQATGKPKGFGFVEMVDSEEAIIAMKVLNGRELLDRNIVVNLAEQKQKPDSRDRFPRGGRSDGQRDRNFKPRGDRNFTPRDGESRPPYNKSNNYTKRDQ